MRAAELRIGNFINFNQYKTYKQGIVRTINNGSCNITNIGDSSPIETTKFNSLIPIPLTEEWLLKLNAKSTELSPAKNGIWIECEIDNQGCWVSISNGTGVVVRRIDYVHQLQNLYFALTDEELTIKL